MQNITFRQLSTPEEYLECVELQKETWGTEFGDIVPASVLKISQKVGGVTAGAFDESGKMLGFVYGITGVKDGRPAHWSHMLAVKKEARMLGLGKKLKFYQRDLLLQMGVDIVYWTFDPLVARNAHLNLNALGTVITEYVENMYVDSSSDLHRGLGMDRFIVAWHLNDERVKQAIEGTMNRNYLQYLEVPIVNTQKDEVGKPIPIDIELPSAKVVRVEVPSDIEKIQAKSLQLASQWRANTRRTFVHYMRSGYSIVDFYFESSTGTSYYCLKHE
ncbi:MAG: hypothetical protein L0Y80_11040 [Ignavibacteriae bacterium]|nr:hypothetical protein [Ignavibacteriota bacterium]